VELPALVEDETGIMHMDLEFSIKEIKHAVSPPRRAPRRVGHLAEQEHYTNINFLKSKQFSAWPHIIPGLFLAEGTKSMYSSSLGGETNIKSQATVF
jgi:hypothetical protein